MSIRTALGASRARLSRQLLMEQLVIAAVSAAISVGVAHGLLGLLAFTRLVPASQIQRSSLDSTTLLFLAALVMMTASALGWVVSRRATRTTAAVTSHRTQSSSREVVRLRQALIALQVSATVVLLIAAGLLIQSAARLVAIDPGFRTDNVITFALGIPPHRYPTPADRVRLIDGVVERLARLPGVAAASSANAAPMTEMRGSRRLAIDGKPLPRPGTEPIAIDTPAGPDYAAIMGLRILDGQWISAADRAETLRSSSSARRLRTNIFLASGRSAVGCASTPPDPTRQRRRCQRSSASCRTSANLEWPRRRDHKCTCRKRSGRSRSQASSSRHKAIPPPSWERLPRPFVKSIQSGRWNGCK